MAHENQPSFDYTLITLPKRGLRVIPPEETILNMKRAKTGEIVKWSDEEKTRLELLRRCKILEKRHPEPQDGKNYMENVDYQQRERLLNLAYELSNVISFQWHKINPLKDIAILLYGSVAKGLVRNEKHPDPSNIDLSVIGDISQSERIKLFSAIRPKRLEIQERIISRCPIINSPEANPGNAGVIIQNIEKVVKDDFGVARSYIAGRAIALYDPADIWKSIELAALRNYKKRHENKH